jgi:thymidylate kinase
LLRAAARLAPAPDLVILLDAPPEVLRARKQEVPMDEVVRQRTAYLELARTLRSVVVVNAGQPPEHVIHDAVTAIMDHLGRRTNRRLGIFSAPAAPSPASKRPW